MYLQLGNSIAPQASSQIFAQDCLLSLQWRSSGVPQDDTEKEKQPKGYLYMKV